MTIPNLNSSYSVGTQSLLSVMPDPMSNNGVFQYLTEFSFIDPESANMEYLYNRSGDKVPSPLVSRLADGDVLTDVSLQSLAKIIKARFQYKWNRLWTDYSDTNPLYNNVNLTTETVYGKSVSGTNSDTFTKSGTETHTLGGEENREESYPDQTGRQTRRTIEGGWKDTDTTKTTRKGTETSTESFPTTRSTVKQTTGTYQDTDTTANTRTGSQLVTDKGDTQAATFGFNSTSAVPVNLSGPADDVNGITQETSFVNLADTKSGGITRTYGDTQGQNPLTETTTESGSKQLATSYGENGITDENAGDVTRLYNSYVDTVQETGRKNLKISYGQNGKTDTLEFNARTDTKSGSSSTTNSGKDTVNQSGYNIRRATDRLEIVSAMYSDPMLFNFFEIIYSDIDEVLTIPVFMR